MWKRDQKCKRISSIYGQLVEMVRGSPRRAGTLPGEGMKATAAPLPLLSQVVLSSPAPHDYEEVGSHTEGRWGAARRLKDPVISGEILWNLSESHSFTVQCESDIITWPPSLEGIHLPIKSKIMSKSTNQNNKTPTSCWVEKASNRRISIIIYLFKAEISSKQLKT